MNKTPHIPFEKLADLAEARLESADLEAKRRETATHLASCVECAGELKRLESVITLMRTDREPDAPRDVLSYAVNLFAQRAQSKSASPIRRLVATLIFDSRRNLTPAFGVRSGLSGSQQLIYSVEGQDLELRLTAEQDKWLVAGQLFGEDCAGGEVKLTSLAAQSEQKSTVTNLNELCEFVLPLVPPGHYQLRVRIGDLQVEIPEFELIA